MVQSHIWMSQGSSVKKHLNVTISERADQNDIELLCLPSNTTHELQPLEKAVFCFFEHFWEIIGTNIQTTDSLLSSNQFGKNVSV